MFCVVAVDDDEYRKTIMILRHVQLNANNFHFEKMIYENFQMNLVTQEMCLLCDIGEHLMRIR
jgi:hypothetical protein